MVKFGQKLYIIFVMMLLSLFLTACGKDQGTTRSKAESATVSNSRESDDEKELEKGTEFQEYHENIENHVSKNVVSVKAESDWMMTTLKEGIVALDENIYCMGCTETGFFYQKSISGKDSDISKSQFGFHSWSGEEEILLDVPGYYYSMDIMCGEILILAMSLVDDEEEGTTIFKLQESQPAQVILKQSDFTIPYLYDNGSELIAVLRDRGNDGSVDINISRLVTYDLETDELTVLLETETSKYKNGDMIICAGGNDKDIYCAINHGVSRKSEIVRYSRSEQKIISRCEADHHVTFVTGMGDRVIVSETDDSTYLERSGYVAVIEENGLSKLCEIPMVEAANRIIRAHVTEEGTYFMTPHSAYLLENAPCADLYVYDFDSMWKDMPVAGVDVTSEGIRFLKEGKQLCRISAP